MIYSIGVEFMCYSFRIRSSDIWHVRSVIISIKLSFENLPFIIINIKTNSKKKRVHYKTFDLTFTLLLWLLLIIIIIIIFIIIIIVIILIIMIMIVITIKIMRIIIIQ